MIKIYLETSKIESNESQFVEAVLSLLEKKKNQDYRIINVGGFAALKKFKNELLDSEKNLLVFDADYPETEGGFEKRKEWLLSQKDNEIDFELFLYPNNKENGILETLLQRIINPKYQEMIQFFKEYENSVKNFDSSLSERTFDVPDEKARIYSYISAFKRTKKEKEAFKNENKWDFMNDKYWNMNAKDLDALKDFFKKHFVNTRKT